MTKLKSLTFSLTDECNLSCSYCYQKSRSRGSNLGLASLQKASDFFLPLLRPGAYISFYGGEPLLRFETLARAVAHIQERAGCSRKVHYSLTTNGTLVDREVARFLSDHRFSVMLSFDGAGTAPKGDESVLNRLIGLPGIDLTTNSVFTPATVGRLSCSLQRLAALGVPEILLSLSTVEPWPESSLRSLAAQIETLSRFLKRWHAKNGKQPLQNFRRPGGQRIFACSAGRGQLSMDADGNLWGCPLFADWLCGQPETEEYDRYCLGSIDRFTRLHPRDRLRALRQYADLRQDFFYTEKRFCGNCPHLGECHVCPATTMMAGSPLPEKVPDWICRIQRIMGSAARRFGSRTSQ